MATWVVWIDKNLAGSSVEEEEVEISDETSEEERLEILRETVDTMINNSVYSGWYQKDTER